MPKRKEPSWRSARLRELWDQGFDQSTRSGRSAIHVKCSQCEALVINGVATHETGCPNIRREQEDD